MYWYITYFSVMQVCIIVCLIQIKRQIMIFNFRCQYLSLHLTHFLHSSCSAILTRHVTLATNPVR